MNTRCTIFIVLILELFSNNILAQGFSPWESLYKDNVITVEVSFKIENASCTNLKKHKIQYRVTGKLSSFDDYLIWTTDYIDCNGLNIFQEHCLNISSSNPSANGSNEAVGDTWTSQEDEFLADKIITKFYDIHTARSPSNKNGVKKNLKSLPADAIEGNTSMEIGSSIILSVKGGNTGAGANWVWYSGSCGGVNIGTGSSINVSPTNTTRYFVRAEGGNTTTSCVEATVKVKSKIPNRIIGNTEIFEGEETTLSIDGGKLTFDAMWVWYRYDVVLDLQKVGTGTSIKVKPLTNTKYCVRAESSNDISDKVEAKVNVKSKAPTSVIGEISVFFGDSAKLMVNGGYLLPKEEWVWYEEKIGGNKIGTGSQITVRPLETTTYYVRAEGLGNNTKDVHTAIIVNEPIQQLNLTNPAINNVNFFNNNGRIDITYDITNFIPSDEFLVAISGYKKNGERLNINSLSGDLSNVKGGNSKKIIWDSKKDGYEFDEKIYFNIVATKKINIPFGTHIVKSIAWPGWGDINLKSKRKATLLYGLSGFALIGTSVLLNQQAIKSYSSYEKSFDVNQSNKYFNDAILKRNLSRIAALSATLVWTIDLAGLYRKYDKVQKNPTKENIPYYYDQSQKVINTNSKLLPINTKSK